MQITLHLLALKLMSHSFSHLSRTWRSSCSCSLSSGMWITLYSRLSSAFWHVVDIYQEEQRKTRRSSCSCSLSSGMWITLYSRLSSTFWHVVDIYQEEQRAEDGALWNTRQYIYLSGFSTFEDNLLFPISEESFNPVVEFPSEPIEVQFVKQSEMGHFVKSLLKTEKDHINLVAIRKVSCYVVDSFNQLCFTRSAFLETMLAVTENIISVKMGHYAAVYYMFQDFIHYRCKWYWMIVWWLVSIPFLKDWNHFGIPPFLWYFSYIHRVLVELNQGRCQFLGSHLKDSGWYLIRASHFMWIQHLQELLNSIPVDYDVKHWRIRALAFIRCTYAVPSCEYRGELLVEDFCLTLVVALQESIFVLEGCHAYWLLAFTFDIWPKQFWLAYVALTAYVLQNCLCALLVSYWTWCWSCLYLSLSLLSVCSSTFNMPSAFVR